MQVEPPGSDLSDHRHHQPVGALRLSAALGAAAIAIASTGHVLVLGGLLALAAAPTSRSDGRSGRAVGAMAALLACTSVLVRWGAPSLSAAGGAQAVLGPAVAVGTTAAAASSLLAAIAIALVAPPWPHPTLPPAQGAARALLPAQGAARARLPAQGEAWAWDLVITGCFGVVVGAVAAGPTLPNDLPVRIVGLIVGFAVVAGASLLHSRRLVATGAFASGALALLLATAA